MKLKEMVVVIGTAVMLFTGCGGGGSGDSYNMLLGTWDRYAENGDGPCINNEEYGYSEIDVLTFKEDVATSDWKFYGELNCQEEDLLEDEIVTWGYSIGNKTEGSEGEEAYEFDVWQLSSIDNGEEETLSDEDKQTLYLMFKIEDGKLSFTDDDNTSADNRSNVFWSTEYYKKR